MPKRSVTQIYDRIMAEKSKHSVLAGLSSSSPTAVYKLLAKVVASVHWLQERALEDHQRSMYWQQAKILPGGDQWYITMLKAFQIDHLLEFIDGRPGYGKEDKEARIIDKVSIKSHEDGRATLFVSKEESSLPAALDDSELGKAKAYLAQIQTLGTALDLQSLPHDRLRANLYVRLNGKTTRSEGQDLTEEFITHYCNTLSPATDFHKEHFINALNGQDWIESVTVDGFEIVDHNGKIEQGPGRIALTSGFVHPDTDSPFTLYHLISYSNDPF